MITTLMQEADSFTQAKHVTEENIFLIGRARPAVKLSKMCPLFQSAVHVLILELSGSSRGQGPLATKMVSYTKGGHYDICS